MDVQLLGNGMDPFQILAVLRRDGQIDADIDAYTAMLWENLNPDNKISLFVRYTDLATGKYEQRILNKHQ